MTTTENPTAEERLFPIMGGPAIPWAMIAPHARQALENHQQTLERLAERGGLDCYEAVCVLNDSHWRYYDRKTDGIDWRAELIKLRDADRDAEIERLRSHLRAATDRAERAESRVRELDPRLSTLTEPWALSETAAAGPSEREVIVAYIRDREGQYDPSSGIVAALGYLRVALHAGEHVEAHRHGELDDLIALDRPNADEEP